MCWPTLMLGGPPKCGTSSLFEWLGDHPDVAVPTVKETFYFVDRDSPFFVPEANVHLHGVDGYRRFRKVTSNGSRHLLDGTTHTIYQKSVIDLLVGLEPRPQMIFVLRNPSQRVFSSFRFTQHNRANIDPRLRFRTFVRHALEGSMEELRPSFRLDRSLYILSRDLEYSRYVEHLRRWRERFGRRHLHLLLFEEMCADPRKVIQDLAHRIDLDPEVYGDYDFSVTNRTTRPRSPGLHRWVRRLAGKLPKNRLTRAGYASYLALQGRRRPAVTSEDEAALAELDAYFAPHNQELARTFDLDLSVWQ